MSDLCLWRSVESCDVFSEVEVEIATVHECAWLSGQDICSIVRMSITKITR